MEEDNKIRFFALLPFINFSLSLFIVMHHSFNIPVDYDVINPDIDWVFERLFYNFSECAVPVFFFISAILFYRNFDGSIKAYLEKIKKRVYSILIPYIVFNLLGYLKHIIFSNDSFTFLGLIKSIVLSDTMPLWFLRELFILVLFAPIIYLVKKKKVFIVIITIIVFVLVVLGYVKYRCFVYWLPIYLFGSTITTDSFMKSTCIVCNKNKCFIICSIILGLFIISWFLPNSINGNDFKGEIAFYSYRLLCVCAIVMIFRCFANSEIKKAPFFMSYSFWVYCVHFPLISICQAVFLKIIRIQLPLINIIEYCLTVIIVYVFAIVIALIFKRFLNPIWLILNGQRK